MNDHITQNADSPHSTNNNLSAHAAAGATTAPETSNIANAGPEHRIISRVVQAATVAFCGVLKEPTLPPTFFSLSAKESDTLEKKVLALRSYPNSTPSELHGSWIKDKAYQGWIAGEPGAKYDEEKKIDPAMVAYDGLAEGEKRKVALFMGLVTAMPTARPAQASQEPSDKGDLTPAKPALDLPETQIEGIARVAYAAVAEYDTAASGTQWLNWPDAHADTRAAVRAGVRAILGKEAGPELDADVYEALGYKQPVSTDTNVIEEGGIFVAVVRALTQSF